MDVTQLKSGSLVEQSATRLFGLNVRLKFQQLSWQQLIIVS